MRTENIHFVAGHAAQLLHWVLGNLGLSVDQILHFCSIIHDSPKVETTQLSIGGETNQVCPHHGIFFSNKKEWNSDTCYHMDEPWRHFAEWKKPVEKNHISYGPIYLKCP